MQIHQLQKNKSQRKKKYIGRGGKRGTTAGRGTKGQKARAGHKMRPEIRDIIKKLPKRRGYRFGPVNASPVPVNVSSLEKIFAANETISPATLVEKKVVRLHGKNLPAIKILGTGNLTKAFTVTGCQVSTPAKTKIEKAGGKIS